MFLSSDWEIEILGETWDEAGAIGYLLKRERGVKAGFPSRSHQ